MRGTGKTRAMVLDLPESGGHVIVHSLAMAFYVRRMIRDLKGLEVERHTVVHVVRQRGNETRLMGMRGHIAIDHAWHDHVPAPLADVVYELVDACRATG